MKTYSIQLTVPDDFDPESLEIDLSYPEGNIEILSEGFIDYSELISKIELIQVKPESSNILIFRFPKEFIDYPEDINNLKQLLESECKCVILGIVNDIDILVQNSAEAVEMLQSMINKVKSRSIIKLV